MFRTLSTFLLLITLASATPLEFSRFDGPAPTFEEKDGVVEISGPMSVRAIPGTPPGPEDNVIEFEYFSIGGVPAFMALPGPPFEAGSARELPALGHSEAWTSYSTRIAPEGKPLPGGWKELRLDLPLPTGRVLQIRNAVLRPERPGEFDRITSSAAGSSSEKELEIYLSEKFPSAVTKVSVGESLVRIEGNVGKETGPFSLADIPMDIVLNDARGWKTLVKLTPGANGAFKIDVPRLSQRNGLPYDRLTSRWQIVREGSGGIEPLSHARYAEWVHSRSPDLTTAVPRNKKGLGGWHLGTLPDELDELGISAVTINLLVHQFISAKPGKGTTPIEWQGRTYHIRENPFAKMDKTLREANEKGAMVSVILLIANPAKSEDATLKLLGHPDARKEGTYAMPNVTSEEGIGIYGAILDFMAERWSRPDAKFGRVHHWIIHNEVDAGWVWTNAGEKPAVVFMDLYQRSMRLTDLIVRQYDRHARPFISLTHHWAEAGSERFFGSRKLIELLLEFCQAEGDFPWALAYHPYPQSLRNPRTWEDQQAIFSFDTPKITPWNLEVLDAYMKQTELLYKGEVRPIHLSENGFNSKDYSPKALEDQAAGMALAWKKMAKLSSIESWQYHNWIDNRKEGGLRIGLRKFPDEKDDPLGKKPIWHLYQALGTPREDAVAAPHLKTIGIGSWDEIIHTDPIR